MEKYDEVIYKEFDEAYNNEKNATIKIDYWGPVKRIDIENGHMDEVSVSELYIKLYNLFLKWKILISLKNSCSARRAHIK